MFVCTLHFLNGSQIKYCTICWHKTNFFSVSKFFNNKQSNYSICCRCVGHILEGGSAPTLIIQTVGANVPISDILESFEVSFIVLSKLPGLVS